MHTTSVEQQKNTQQQVKERYTFVVQLHDGRYVVGSATNPCKRIVALNSGHNPAVPKALQVNRVIGVKPVEEGRNAVSVFKKIEAKYGEGSVIAIWPKDKWAT